MRAASLNWALVVIIAMASCHYTILATHYVARRLRKQPTRPVSCVAGVSTASVKPPAHPPELTPVQSTATFAATKRAARINCHAMSDVGLLGRCCCGERSLHSSPLSTLATCSSCARTWAVVRSTSYFIPVECWHAFARHNSIELGGEC